MSTLLLAGYIIVAVLSLAMTQQERRLHPDQPQPFAILGIVACLLWPVPVVVALIMLFQQGNGADPQTGSQIGPRPDRLYPDRRPVR